VSNAAHPGYARTNLQTSGPGREKHLGEKIMEAFMSHDAARGRDAVFAGRYGKRRAFRKLLCA
jgi:hypothetical protein